MGRIGLKSKLKRLEKRQGKRRVNALALEFDCDATGAPISPEIGAWLSTPTPRPENAPAAFLARYAGILNRRVILCPRFSSEAAWEAACLAQQKALQAVCRSRTNEPAQVAPPSVGKSEAFTEAAPLQPGTKRGRFIELADGRTFDRETGEFLEEAAKALPAGGLKAIFKH